MTIDMPKLRYIRPSSADVWCRCSAAPKEVERLADFTGGKNAHNAISAAGDPAREGQLGHEAAEQLLHGETEINVRGLALKYGVSESDAEFMVGFARRAVKNMPWPGWRFATEQALKFEVNELLPDLTGTCDFLAWSEPDADEKYALGIIDWKFGRNEVKPPHNNFQVWCYAVMAAKTFELGPVKSVSAQLRYPRLGQRSGVVVFNEQDLAAMSDSLRHAIIKCYAESPEYRTGQHCENCNAKTSCPALNKALAVHAESLAATEGKPPRSLMQMSPQEAGAALSTVRLVQRWAAEYTAQAKIYVDQKGPIKLPDGRVFTKASSKRRSIDLSAEGAWPVLESACGRQALLDGVKISKTAAVNAAKSKFLSDNNKSRFGRGELKQLETELMDALEQEGAVNEYESTRYEYKNAQKGDQ